MAADATATLSQQVDKLKEKAAQVRRDADCAKDLASAHPAIEETFQRALDDEALRRAIEAEVREALSTRARVPVTMLDARRDPANDDAFPFVKQAKERALPTVVSVDIVSLNLRAEATGDACRYAVSAVAEIAWWDVENHLVVYRNDGFGRERLPLEAFDLPLLLDRPDELRSRVARGFRDAVASTFDAPQLKFADSKPSP